MALTIDATAGSASANSFLDEAEQVAYMATRLNASAWTTVTGATCTESEKAAMIEATRELSALRWRGDRADDVQALAWPRAGVTDPDSAVGADFATDTVPVAIRQATAELAFQFLKAGTTDLAAADPVGEVTQKVVGPLSTTYAAPHQRAHGIDRFPSVTRFLRGLRAASGLGTVEVFRA